MNFDDSLVKYVDFDKQLIVNEEDFLVEVANLASSSGSSDNNNVSDVCSEVYFEDTQVSIELRKSKQYNI